MFWVEVLLQIKAGNPLDQDADPDNGDAVVEGRAGLIDEGSRQGIDGSLGVKDAEDGVGLEILGQDAVLARVHKPYRARSSWGISEWCVEQCSPAECDMSILKVTLFFGFSRIALPSLPYHFSSGILAIPGRCFSMSASLSRDRSFLSTSCSAEMNQPMGTTKRLGRTQVMNVV
jgi:hypothetical protein